MSFMFSPFPYNDPCAVNHIANDGSVDLKTVSRGTAQLAAVLAGLCKEHRVIAIDGYTTAPFDTLLGLLPPDVATISTASILKSPQELKTLLADYLPEDREKDPVLLYGRLFEQGYRGLFDESKLNALKAALSKSSGVTVLYGNGALSGELYGLADLHIFADVTPKQAVLNIRHNGYRNLGSDEDFPFKTTMRRCYYVDFELAFSLRCELLANKKLDYYICADRPDDMQMLPAETLFAWIDRALDYPLRQRPVYLEGVWGGYFVMKERHLPADMKNCAWVFDLIPMEVSTVLCTDGYSIELPFYTIVASNGKKLMGQRCLDEFHGFFPIRFNYDDTYHSGGNMSIQLHPGERFVTENNGELGRQDESYYIVATGQGAKTYLGFRQQADAEEFIQQVKTSETEHTPVDYQAYIYGVESKPGVQVMIPAGTIHASGQNQLILEIGSLTVGSYTYKMYDYLRKDLDGNPRPIHSYFGALNLNREMKEDYVRAHLVNGNRRVLRSGDGWQELVVGECEQLYFSLRNLKFVNEMQDDTDGDFHVLALVDGESITVRSKADHSLHFDLNFLDIVVVPASMGKYELINNKPGTWITVHKTMLKR